MCFQYEIVYTGADVQKVTLKLLVLVAPIRTTQAGRVVLMTADAVEDVFSGVNVDATTLRRWRNLLEMTGAGKPTAAETGVVVSRRPRISWMRPRDVTWPTPCRCDVMQRKHDCWTTMTEPASCRRISTSYAVTIGQICSNQKLHALYSVLSPDVPNTGAFDSFSHFCMLSFLSTSFTVFVFVCFFLLIVVACIIDSYQ